jgi:putative hemolysin
MNDSVAIVGLVLLILINAFFVLAETALLSVRKTRVNQLVNEGNVAARLVQRALERLGNNIASIQLGITLTTLATGVIAEPALGRLIDPGFKLLGAVGSLADALVFATTFIISAGLSIIFAELVPKRIAIAQAERVLLVVIYPLQLVSLLFGPIARLLEWLGKAVLRLLNIKDDDDENAHSEDEIRQIVDKSREQGILQEEERELVSNVFDFSDSVVGDIMVPRVKMFTVEDSLTLRQFLEFNQGYSRVPVRSRDTDEVVGIVRTADVLKHLNHLDRMTVGQIMRRTQYVPAVMKVYDLFKLMQERKAHIAIVVDEDGGTDGLVTLENVLEELVGDIYDETDEIEDDGIECLSDGVYVFDASLKIEDVEEVLSIKLDKDDEGEFEKLSGFVYHHFGYIPQTGEEFDFEGWQFRVDAADERKVLKVRVSKPGGNTGESNSGSMIADDKPSVVPALPRAEAESRSLLPHIS